MSSPRLLWVIKGLNRGGAERLVTVMAPKIRSHGYHVDVVYVTQGASAFVPELRASGIDVTCLEARHPLDLRWAARLARLVRSKRYDLVHTHSPLPAAVARLVAPRALPIVHTEHNMWGVYRGATFAVNACTFARNASAFAVSDGVAASMARPLWARVGTMPPVTTLLHGVDAGASPRGPEARRKAREQLDLGHQTAVIGNVANFSPKKDHHTLLEAFDRLQDRMPDSTLLLIGMGPLEAEIRAEIAHRGLSETVHLLGTRDDVADLLPALDCFVLSSQFEGLPISLLEAMAAEVACVTTSVGGIPEAIRDGEEGALVPPGNGAALSDAMVTVLSDSRYRSELAAAGRRRVLAEFSIDAAVETQVKHYERVLPHRGT